MSHWLHDLSVPLRTLDPDDPDMSDLEPLRNIVGSARVVCIGESAHGVSEFYHLKDRIFRFLVRELGFSAYILESGFPEGLDVDAWIAGGPGDLEEVTGAGVTYGFGAAAGLRAQVEWMRRWNATQSRQLHFYGMDVPGSCASPGPGVRACLQRLPARPGDAALLALSDLGGQFDAVARYAAMTPEQHRQLSAGIAELIDRATQEGDEIAMQCALSLLHLDDILVNGWADGRNPRDESMADTVSWVLGREQRVVIGAHNGHIQRASYNGQTMLGQLLDADIGADMVNIGTTYASGIVARIRPRSAQFADWEVSQDQLHPPPHTLDAVLDEADWPLHLLDLRRVPSERLATATAMLLNHDSLPLDPRTAFDAIVHVRHVTPVPGAFERMRADVDRVASTRTTLTSGS